MLDDLDIFETEVSIQAAGELLRVVRDTSNEWWFGRQHLDLQVRMTWLKRFFIQNHQTIDRALAAMF